MYRLQPLVTSLRWGIGEASRDSCLILGVVEGSSADVGSNWAHIDGDGGGSILTLTGVKGGSVALPAGDDGSELMLAWLDSGSWGERGAARD